MSSTYFDRYVGDEWLGGSESWGLRAGHDASDPTRRMLIATTAPHVEPIDRVKQRFAAAAGRVVLIDRQVHDGRDVDVLIEARPTGTPSTARAQDAAQSRTLLTAAAREIERLHREGFVIGSLRPELVFVDHESRLTGIAPFSEIFFRGIAPESTPNRYPFEDLYMAPELVRVEEAGPAADVFCVAACFVRWQTGRYPFAGETFIERMMSLATSRLHPSIDATTLPASIVSGLSSNPADRPRLDELG